MNTLVTPIQKNRLAELLAARKAARGEAMGTVTSQQRQQQVSTYIDSPESLEDEANTASEEVENNNKLNSAPQFTDQRGQLITYNSKQTEAIQAAVSGEHVIVIGAAGTGKTTCMRGVIETLLQQTGRIPALKNCDHKHLADGSPGIVLTSFTRRAVANLRKAMSSDLQPNCITLHKLLEFGPVYYEVVDPETGDEKTTMRFEPARNAYNPLPSEIQVIVIDESSMVSVELFEQLCAALTHEVQFIFLGDIQQLPPVFGSAILGYKMLEWRTIELTEVYRQALESPIIRLAHRILSGVPIKSNEYDSWHEKDKLKLHPWKKKLHQDIACLTAAKFFTTALDHGGYDPEEDIILIPFNKAFGTDEINKHIANHVARKENKVVWEIVAGFNKYYFSVGDKVLFDKEDAVIVEIVRNGSYTGKQAQHEASTLDYWGHNSAGGVTESEKTEEEVDFLLEQAAAVGVEDRVRQASHIVKVRRLGSEVVEDLDTASEINSMILGYALTVHKSQGSEWRKVFLCFHQSHATMLQRELLYTAVTRAREELYVICEPETFERGIISQRIKGDTLADKAEFFKGKLESNGGLMK